jgi:hypothetical protein
MRFFAAELETFRPGASAPTIWNAWGEQAIGQPQTAGAVVSQTALLRVSDIGWVTPNTDPAGAALAYPPILSSAFAVDRQLDLAIDGQGAGVAWGGLRFLDPGGTTSGAVGDRNVDSRTIRILMGKKTYDRTRGLFLNPMRASMSEVFVGLARQWRPDEDGLNVPMRDATHWLERQLQTATYAGTGGAEGPAELKGRPKPKLRGGLTGASVRNISPVLIDATANIWQISDGPAGIDGSLGLYENGKSVFGFAGETTDLWTGTTPAGQFRQDHSKGLFQLGSPVAGQITCDAHGQVPGAGGYTLNSAAASLAVFMMQYDLGVPLANIDLPSFAAVTTALGTLNSQAGWYWDGASPTTGADAVGMLMGGVGARIVPGRNGKLRAMLLRAPQAANIIAGFTADQVVSIVRAPLPEGLSPPPFRIRVGHTHNHTVMSADRISATLRNTPRQQFLAEADRFASWGGTPIVNAYLRPSDPPPMPTPILTEGSASVVAANLGALWGITTERKLYQIEIPLDVGLARDIGDTVRLTYPIPDLEAGAPALIVGEQFRSESDTIMFTVLV